MTSLLVSRAIYVAITWLVCGLGGLLLLAGLVFFAVSGETDDDLYE